MAQVWLLVKKKKSEHKPPGFPQFQVPEWNRLDWLTGIVNGDFVDGLLIVML